MPASAELPEASKAIYRLVFPSKPSRGAAITAVIEPGVGVAVGGSLVALAVGVGWVGVGNGVSVGGKVAVGVADTNGVSVGVGVGGAGGMDENLTDPAAVTIVKLFEPAW